MVGVVINVMIANTTITVNGSINVNSFFYSVNSPILLQYPPKIFLIQNPTLICENFIQN